MAAQEYLDAAKSSHNGHTAGVPYNFEFYVPDEEASSGTRPMWVKGWASFARILNFVMHVPHCFSWRPGILSCSANIGCWHHSPPSPLRALLNRSYQYLNDLLVGPRRLCAAAPCGADAAAAGALGLPDRHRPAPHHAPGPGEAAQRLRCQL